MADENSRWLRAASMAERPDVQGRVIHHPEAGWIYVLGRKMKRLSSAEDLETAIEAADQFHPPGAWTYDPEAFKWTREHWEVRFGGEGWTVWRTDPESGEMTQASVAIHPSADRARRWAELRLDRSQSNLRGPVPRAGRASTSKLPDVRVTPEEREDAFALMDQLNLSYAAFVRAALRFAEEHLDGGDWMVVSEGKAHTFQARPALAHADELLSEQTEWSDTDFTP